MNNKDKKYLTFEDIVSVDCDYECQETSVAFYRDEKSIRWFTCDNEMVTLFKWKVKEFPDVYKMYVSSYAPSGKPAGYFIEMPRDMLSFRGKKREVSQEKRKQTSMRLKEMHEKRRIEKQQAEEL